MSRKRFILALLCALGAGLLTACSLLSRVESFPPTHPQALEPGRPQCSGCHGEDSMPGGLKTYASFDHTPTFVKEHRFAANRDSGTCAACHSQSFCSDCHSGKTMMTPSTKLGDRPDRDMPHRAGYLTLHRIDAKMDPSGCFKCHGRANNETCRACHR